MTAQPTTFSPPVPSGLAKTVVDQLAGQVAAKLGYKPGQDLKSLVSKLGGVLDYEPWEEATEGGSLEVNPEKKSFRLRISPYVGALRNRFTIAHELGHYFLHSEVGKKPIQARREGTGRVEWEANWFAAGFLMPAESFKEDWKRHRGDMGALIGIYQVSEAVIEIRRESLGLK